MKPGSESDFVTEALPAFISEAEEQIEMLEQLLLQLEDAPEDAALLNALFRCAHTIKGSAGIFGLDRVVAFTHHVETLLSKLREGRVKLTPDMSTLLLRCNDQVLALIAQAKGAREDDAESMSARGELVLLLQAASGAPPAAAPLAVATASNQRCWHVSAAFGADTFRNGMDPLTILNYVRGLGDVPRMVCDVDAIPPLERLDPESCRLSFEFGLLTEAQQDQIEGAFSFVRDDCQLGVMPPAPSAAAEVSPVLSDTVGVAPAVVEAALKKPVRTQQASPPREAAASGSADDQRFIRVQAHRLDDVINLLGELVIAGAGASLLARQTKQRKLVEANAQISRLIEEIRNGTFNCAWCPSARPFRAFAAWCATPQPS
jgi:two-component system chemotaxis sensor kinase CheA